MKAATLVSCANFRRVPNTALRCQAHADVGSTTSVYTRLHRPGGSRQHRGLECGTTAELACARVVEGPVSLFLVEEA